MKITFLLTQDLESPAGAGRYFPLAKALTRLGHQVSIAALHASFDTLAHTHIKKDGVEIWYVAQMHVRKQDSKKIYYSTHKLLFLSIQATWALTQAALKIPADIIHIGKPHPMNSVAGLIAKYAHRKRIYLDCDDYEAANARFTGSWQKQIISFFEKTIPHHVQHITTHTHVLKNYMLSLGVPPERITYLPHGVDLERFAPLAPAKINALRSQYGLVGKKVIVFVGSMSLVSHAINILLEAFQIVRQTLPEAVLMLVGGGEDFERLQNLAQELRLLGSVLFCGRVPHQDAPLYYRLSDVSVDPVHDNDAGRASISIKMFESWAAETPLVTVAVGDRSMLLGSPPAGLLAQPGDPSSLADAILKILNDPELADKLRQLGMDRAEKFSWDRLARQLEIIYLQAPPN